MHDGVREPVGSSVVLFLLQLCIAWSGLVKKLDALALVIGRSVYGNAETDKLAVAAGNQVILVALAITDAMMHQGGESLVQHGDGRTFSLRPPKQVPNLAPNPEERVVVWLEETSIEENACLLHCVLGALVVSLTKRARPAGPGVSGLSGLAAAHTGATQEAMSAKLIAFGVSPEDKDTSWFKSVTKRMAFHAQALLTPTGIGDTAPLRAIVVAAIEGVMRSAAAGHYTPTSGLAVGDLDLTNFSGADGAALLTKIHANDVAAGEPGDDSPVMVGMAEVSAVDKEFDHSGGWYEALFHMSQNGFVDHSTVLPIVVHFLFAAGDVIEVYECVVHGKAASHGTALESSVAADFITIRETANRGYGEAPGQLIMTQKHADPVMAEENRRVHRILIGVHGDMLGHRASKTDQLKKLNHYAVLAAGPVGGEHCVSARRVIRKEIGLDVAFHAQARVLMHRYGKTDGMIDGDRHDHAAANCFSTAAKNAADADAALLSANKAVSSQRRCAVIRANASVLSDGILSFTVDVIETLCTAMDHLREGNGDGDASTKGLRDLLEAASADSETFSRNETAIELLDDRQFKTWLTARARLVDAERLSLLANLSASRADEEADEVASEGLERAQALSKELVNLRGPGVKKDTGRQRGVVRMVHAVALEAFRHIAILHAEMSNEGDTPTAATIDAAWMIGVAVERVLHRTFLSHWRMFSDEPGPSDFRLRSLTKGTVKLSETWARAHQPKQAPTQPKPDAVGTDDLALLNMIGDFDEITDPLVLPDGLRRASAMAVPSMAEAEAPTKTSTRLTGNKKKDKEKKVTVVPNHVHNVLTMVIQIAPTLTVKVLVDWGPEFGKTLALDKAAAAADADADGEGRHTWEVEGSCAPEQWAAIKAHRACAGVVSGNARAPDAVTNQASGQASLSARPGAASNDDETIAFERILELIMLDNPSLAADVSKWRTGSKPASGASSKRKPTSAGKKQPEPRSKRSRRQPPSPAKEVEAGPAEKSWAKNGQVYGLS